MQITGREELMRIVTALIKEGIVDYIYEMRKVRRDPKSTWRDCDNYLNKWFDRTAFERTFEVSYVTGETKGVIILPDQEWVIKFALPGEDYDFCARECENYALAEELGLGEYFAATEFLWKHDGFSFFAQQYVDCDECVDCEIADSLRNEYSSRGDEVPDEWELTDEAAEMGDLDRIDYLYGNAALCRFVSERHINDLHCGNFGKMGDIYVMVDYSGYGAGVYM